MADTTEKKWTRAQTAAINTTGRNLLVSAAAGSGKTATLTERIIKSITYKDAEKQIEPADISKMLVVTFTRAAATELKERIFTSLSKELAKNPENRHLNEQLLKLGSADICTIDSFYLNVIRQNFSTLGISASCRIADEGELKLLKEELMDNIIDFFYDNDSTFPSFAECFVGTKELQKLRKYLIALYDNLVSRIEGIDFLKQKADELQAYAANKTDFFTTPYGKVIIQELCDFFEYAAKISECGYNHLIGCGEVFEKRALSHNADKEIYIKLYNTLASDNITYNEIRGSFAEISFPTLGSVKKELETNESLYFKDFRDKLKKKTNDFNTKLFSRTDAVLYDEMLETARRILTLYDILTEFSKMLNEEKSRRSIMDFNDIRQYAFKLFINEKGEPTELAKKYSQQYTHIYIDEYQDVDSVQDAIFSAISNNNRFMVGDIKQSIYGFRGAEPSVFARYRSKYYTYDTDSNEPLPEDVGDTAIFMSENFRCDSTVIDFTNAVCSEIFNICRDSIGYTSADDLRFSKAKPSDDYSAPKVEIAIIDTNSVALEDSTEEASLSKETEKITRDELEAEFIAEKIFSLVGKERNANGTLIVPGDIAVIYRSKRMLPLLVTALGKRGILCSEGGGDYFESPEVLLTLSLLNTVDNPHRDIHLTATLLSPLFEFTMDELIEIRLSSNANYSLYDALLEYSQKPCTLGEKCRCFECKLTELRTEAIALPVDRFLRTLFESEMFLAAGLLADRNDYGEGGNLLTLYEYARNFEAGSFKGLYNFIEFINNLIENGQELAVSQKDRSAGRVNLTTMHHSKGLEFPICFVCNTGSGKNKNDLKKSLVFDYPLGIAMKLSDNTGWAQINTPLREAIIMSKDASGSEEEMRILYVALTRARERLFITATIGATGITFFEDKNIQALNKCAYPIKHFNRFLDFILLPFSDISDEKSYAKINIYGISDISYKDIDNEADTDNTEEEKKYDNELYQSIKDIFEFQYPYTDLLKLPAKLSVSRLSPSILDENDTSLELFSEIPRATVPDFFIEGKISQASAAERGIATHLFLQFCNFERAKIQGIEEEIARLVEKHFIPENIAQLIYKNELEQFILGAFADKILSAEKIIREQRFNLLLPAKLFTENTALATSIENEMIAVQGVIDLLLIDKNGNIELYDYKTDRLSKEELNSSELAKKKLNAMHGLQLSYYAYAVSKLFDKKCSRVCVYSTHSGMLYDIDIIPLKLSTDT